jgi:hypothetical protein
MRIYELTCDVCDTAYNVAESATIPGDASQFNCAVCGSKLIKLDAPCHRVCRLVAPAEWPHFHAPHDVPLPLVNT